MTEHGNPIAEQLAARASEEGSQGAEEGASEEESRNGTADAGELTPEQEQAVEAADNPDKVRELLSRYGRENRSLQTELKRYRDQAKAAEDAQKSAEQRLTEENTTLKQELAALRLMSLRSDIGAKYNLSPQMAQRLRGDTQDEIEADAKALADELGTTKLPDLGQGARAPAPARGDGAFNDMIRTAAGRPPRR